MSFLDMLNPEAIVTNMLAKMGVTPQQLAAAYNLVVTEFLALRQERAAAKSGAARAVGLFIERLDAQDRKLAEIERLLRDASDNTAAAPDGAAILPLRIAGSKNV